MLMMHWSATAICRRSELHNPLYFIRMQLQLDGDEGIYLISLGPNNYRDACYLPDRLAPGTEDFLETLELSPIDL